MPHLSTNDSGSTDTNSRQPHPGPVITWLEKRGWTYEDLRALVAIGTLISLASLAATTIAEYFD